MHGKQSYILKSKEVKITAFALYFANIVGAHLHENETKWDENESKGVQLFVAEMPLLNLIGTANRGHPW